MDTETQRHGKQAPKATAPAVELDDVQLDQAHGGASDYLLELDGIKGETADSRSMSPGTTPLSLKRR